MEMEEEDELDTYDESDEDFTLERSKKEQRKAAMEAKRAAIEARRIGLLVQKYLLTGTKVQIPL